MLHGRDFYNMMLHALERNLGAHHIDDVTSGDKLFLIDDSMFGSDEMDRTLRIFTKDFIVEANMTISLGDTSKDSGSWEKDFYAHEVTSKYYPDAKKVSNKEINDWLSKNAIEFI